MTSETFYDVLTQDRIRKLTARKMKESVAEKPHVTLHVRVDASRFLLVREELSKEISQHSKSKFTVTVLLAALVAHALKEYPRMNGRTEENEIRSYHDINVGIAVAIEDGLVVPVIRQCDAKSLIELAETLDDLTQKARAKSLGLADLTDGTFTITNLGAYGVEFFTPIINPPQLAILGVGTIGEEVRIIDGVVTSAKVLHLSLSFDHAALDGVDAAKFLQMVVARVEDPMSYLPNQPIEPARTHVDSKKEH
jgi:pyruvate dehydrogenase E2 component (dihydrolipoamide acetyltransferase)